MHHPANIGHRSAPARGAPGGYRAGLRARDRAQVDDRRRFALRLEHIVAGDRQGVDLLGQLQLEDHHVRSRKATSQSREVELPHPAEALVVDRGDLGALGLEALAPVAQRLGVVQAQDLDVGDPQARLLDRRQHLRQRRDIAAGEDVFAAIQGLVGPGPSYRPMEWSRATPSSAQQRASCSKNRR